MSEIVHYELMNSRSIYIIFNLMLLLKPKNITLSIKLILIFIIQVLNNQPHYKYLIINTFIYSTFKFVSHYTFVMYIINGESLWCFSSFTSLACNKAWLAYVITQDHNTRVNLCSNIYIYIYIYIYIILKFRIISEIS